MPSQVARFTQNDNYFDYKPKVRDRSPSLTSKGTNQL